LVCLLAFDTLASALVSSDSSPFQNLFRPIASVIVDSLREYNDKTRKNEDDDKRFRLDPAQKHQPTDIHTLIPFEQLNK